MVLIMGECSADGVQLGSCSACDAQPLRAGFGATLGCWAPQLEQLLAPRQGSLTRVLLMDNRGVGRSDSPEDKRAYTTRLMAADILAMLDELGWSRVHVIGHSMVGAL